MSDEATTAASSDPTTGHDKDFLEATVKAIVDHPEDVIVERTVDDLGVLIKLRVNEADMSKIVGKEGRTAKALRTLLRLVGSKFDQRVNLKILEPDGSERRAETEKEVPAATKKVNSPAKPAVAKSKEGLSPKSGAKEEASAKEGEEAAGAFENVI
ncbi:KH domain-containing protein [Patescibacteria group bacterium]|nr:KH domain-containing protein [Patescibacteria group bacterium]